MYSTLIEQIKNQFANIPGASYIELDRICQERIIDKIEKINFTSRNALKEMYDEFKNDIGKSSEEFLEISDFDSNIKLLDRKSTRLNSSHTMISYAVFCLKKKKPTFWRRNL